MKTLIEQVEAVTVLPNSLAIWGLGQAGMIIKGADAVVYIDPYLTGEMPMRAFPPPLRPDHVTNADYILCTHEHMDHFDGGTLAPALAASPNAKIVAPAWCFDRAQKANIDLTRMIPARDTITLPGTSLRLTVVPAAHSPDYRAEYDDEKGHRWLGYMIEWNGVTLYHAGDTVVFDGLIDALRDLPKPDVAMLPINGRDWFREQQQIIGNMNPNEAVRLAALMEWEFVVPLHNDLFPGNSISWAQWAQAIEDVAPFLRYKRIQPGELFYYVKV